MYMYVIDNKLYSILFYISNSGGDLQWFAVVCGGLPASSLVSLPIVQIMVVVCGGVWWCWWFMVVCGGLW